MEPPRVWRANSARSIVRASFRTLGEEESADFLLSAISEPIMQQVPLDDAGAPVNLETVGENGRKRSPADGTKTTAKACKRLDEVGSRR
jgi:hypothetical protein